MSFECNFTSRLVTDLLKLVEAQLCLLFSRIHESMHVMCDAYLYPNAIFDIANGFHIQLNIFYAINNFGS